MPALGLDKVKPLRSSNDAPLAAQAAARGGLRIVASEHQEVYRALRQYPLFDGIPNDEFVEAITSGELEIRKFWRDDLVVCGQTLRAEGARIFLVKSGQIAVGIFPENVLAEEREWMASMGPEDRRKKVRAQGPLMKRADKNLATFGEGDLFNSEAIPAADSARCAFFALTPSELIVLSKPRIARLTSRYPFFATRLRRAVEVARSRLSGISGVKQEIFDFFVRHGLSVAETLRVRQIDRCIECKECEKACEERYGHKRLSIFGPRLGMLDFIFTCRSCVDQRCIDPCNYDSIRYDAKRREIVINEATCTGCAACAVGCPYGAIEMVPLGDPAEKRLKARLEAAGALAYGDGTGRREPLEKIAQKCDHCMSYGDQACVSHCPTGALIEIRPADIFKDQGDIAKNAARAGYDQTVIVNAGEMLPSDPFKKGLGITDFADAKVKQRRVSPALIWGIGLAGFFAALAEIVLRMWKPAWSLQYALFRMQGLEAEIARLKVGYRAGSELAVNLGYVGTGLMVVAMLYPMRKRIRLLQRLSTSAAWFDLHMMGGVVGPLLITLHSALRLDNWVSFAFWSMIIVVLSGLVGRYLYIQVPELLSARELEELEHERAIARHRTSVPDAVSLVDAELAAYRGRLTSRAARLGAWTAMAWMVVDDLARPYRAIRRGLLLRRTKATPRTRRELARHAGELLLAARRRALLPRVHGVLQQWKGVHVAFTFIMTILAIVHIVVAMTYSM